MMSNSWETEEGEVEECGESLRAGQYKELVESSQYFSVKLNNERKLRLHSMEMKTGESMEQFRAGLGEEERVERNDLGRKRILSSCQAGAEDELTKTLRLDGSAPDWYGEYSDTSQSCWHSHSTSSSSIEDKSPPRPAISLSSNPLPSPHSGTRTLRSAEESKVTDVTEGGGEEMEEGVTMNIVSRISHSQVGPSYFSPEKFPVSVPSNSRIHSPSSHTSLPASRSMCLSASEPSAADIPQAVTSAVPVVMETAPGSKGRRITLQCYKARKEVEKRQICVEDKGNESNSCSIISKANLDTSFPPDISILQYSVTSDTDLDTTGNGKGFTGTGTTKGDLETEHINDSDMELDNIDQICDNELVALRDFHLLDELGASDINNNDDNDSLGDDEVDRMLEEKVPNAKTNATENIEPQAKIKKLVMEERGFSEVMEVLPPGWTIVTHVSGIPLYFHKDSRVVTASRPYELGCSSSLRKHHLPVSAIPCLSYRYYTEQLP